MTWRAFLTSFRNGEFDENRHHPSRRVIRLVFPEWQRSADVVHEITPSSDCGLLKCSGHRWKRPVHHVLLRAAIAPTPDSLKPKCPVTRGMSASPAKPRVHGPRQPNLRACADGAAIHSLARRKTACSKAMRHSAAIVLSRAETSPVKAEKRFLESPPQRA